MYTYYSNLENLAALNLYHFVNLGPFNAIVLTISLGLYIVNACEQ